MGIDFRQIDVVDPVKTRAFVDALQNLARLLELGFWMIHRTISKSAPGE